MKRIDQVSIRRQNILRIWEILCAKPAVTRQEIAEGTGLSLMSVSNLVDHLASLDVLSFDVAPSKEFANGRRSAGRKAELISLKQTKQAWLIFDLTDEYFRLTALSLDLSTILSVSAFSGEPGGNYLDNLTTFLHKAQAETQKLCAQRQILGVAIVAPGPYDVERDSINNQRLPALNSIRIKTLFREHFGAFDYYVDEDVKFAVRAYLPVCVRESTEVLFYLYIGKGVGGAALHSENVLRGHNAAAGDVGQLRVGQQPYEALLSLRVFADACGLDSRAQISEEVLLANITQLALEKDGPYRRVLMENARIIGEMLHSVVWMLDPGVVVIDCRYARAQEADFLAGIEQSLARALEGAQLNRPLLMAASHEMDSITYGAARVLSRAWIDRVI